MPEPDFTIRSGETSSVIYSTLEDEDEAAVNINGATVKFKMAPINGSGTPVLNVAASNDQNGDGSDGTKGKVSYAWVSGNTSVSGWYLAEWEVTFVGGAVQVYPNDSYVVVYVTPEETE